MGALQEEVIDKGALERCAEEQADERRRFEQIDGVQANGVGVRRHERQ